MLFKCDKGATKRWIFVTRGAFHVTDLDTARKIEKVDMLADTYHSAALTREGQGIDGTLQRTRFRVLEKVCPRTRIEKCWSSASSTDQCDKVKEIARRVSEWSVKLGENGCALRTAVE